MSARTPPASTRRSFRGCVAASTILALALLSVIAALPAQAAPKGSRWGAAYFPNHIVTDQNNRQYRFYDQLVKDKIVVINFIYTNCPDICGLQTARMAQVQDKLGARLGKDIFIYSISLDPAKDTPQVLKTYSAAFSAKPGWLFLTGPTKALHQIRYKLGERSRSLAEHRNDAVLGNDRTGEWGRSSMMANLDLLTQEILDMDPAVRAKPKPRRGSRLYGQAPHFKVGKERGQALFLKACSACHSIGMGKRIGPDLEGVAQRRAHGWLTEYMITPGRVRGRRDPIAVELGKAFPGVRMPNLGLAKTDAADLIAYFQSETARLSRGSTDTASTKPPAPMHKHHQHKKHKH